MGKVEVAIMGSPSRMISVDIEQYLKMGVLNKPRMYGRGGGGIFAREAIAKIAIKHNYTYLSPFTTQT